MNWICCQLGAREHYAIPRALFRQGILNQIITDAWVPPTSILQMVGEQRPEIRDRCHEELKEAPVTSFNWSLIAFEVLSRARGLRGWPLIMARNRWFQRKVVSFLRSQLSTNDSQPILFSYSYSALEPFRYAKSRGWKTVLAQIDPGPEEERIVAEEAARVPELAGDWQPAPPEYWDSWKEECNLADRIVVNSEWSREGLVRRGVAPEKLSVIPLAYEMGVSSGRLTEPRLQRRYPDSFTFERPLRVLFLGLLNLRKGVARLLEAAKILRDEPVEFWMVGPVEIANASTVVEAGRVKWFGPTTRKQTAEYYRNADVFILPTLSDGFAITQLEAQAYNLPIIASRQCGDVVIDRVNGLLLEEPIVSAIEEALRFCLDNPDQLAQFSENATVGDRFSLSFLGSKLCGLAR